MESTRPSKKQRELLSYIDNFIKDHDYGPSYREIMRALDYKSVSTVAIHINELIKKGHLIKHEHSARSLEVVTGVAELVSHATVAEGETDPKQWFLAIVEERFTATERAVSAARIDELFVLVGALHIIGFDEAYRSYKKRLLRIQKEVT
jgi:repressor LexA